VALSNRRLLRMEDGRVSFQWKDYRDPQQPQKVMTVSAEEFIRRFLQHALPPGFQRIRYYGFLANCHRKAKLNQCRQLLASPCSDLLPRPADYRDPFAALTGRELRHCPQCGLGILACIQFLPPVAVCPEKPAALVATSGPPVPQSIPGGISTLPSAPCPSPTTKQNPLQRHPHTAV
jgi:hypothetical protein